MIPFQGPPRKIPYTPSENKRYEVSEDQFSRRRIKFLRDLHHSLEKEFRIPISFSIFGSLVKGKILTPETAEYADIDLYIDLDSETLELRTKDIAVKKTIERRVKEEIIKNADYLGYARDLKGSIHMVILDDGSIPEAIKYIRKDFPWGESGSAMEIEVASFFTLSIGSVIKKYRNKFLLSLAQQTDQDEAEKVWKFIKDCVEKIERKDKIPEKIAHQFPKTLQDALKFYGVKITS